MPQICVVIGSLLQFNFYKVIELLLCFLLIVKGQNLEKSRSVWVEQGLVRGKIYKLNEQQVQIFRGIPYAEPPVGELRFKVSKKSVHF